MGGPANPLRLRRNPEGENRKAWECPMAKHLIRRAIFVFVALIGATAVVFAMSRMAGGDPALLYAKPSGYGDEEYPANLREGLGFDRPILAQYLGWAGRLVRGDMGRSLLSESPVVEVFADVIQEKIASAAALSAAFFAGVVVFSLTVKRTGIWDCVGEGAALFARIPPFFLGFVLGLLWATTLTEAANNGDLPLLAGAGFILIVICLTADFIADALRARLTRESAARKAQSAARGEPQGLRMSDG